MPDLHIRLKRHPDGSASITCTRRDGTTTWQRQIGQLGWVFPPHDLTHYAVETTLHTRGAFYGLIADGWEINDFAKPWPRGPIPAEAMEVEAIVGALDMERLNVMRMSAAEFSAHAGREVTVRPIDEVQLSAMRDLRAELLGRWAALGAGDALELEFDRSWWTGA